MDRRNFIKLTAITGATTSLAACGSPETHLIRFIPDDELVPGVAEWKPSICPLCQAGCGLTVRVMEGDAEVVRNGQAGVVKMGLARKLEGNPGDPIGQGKLCVRGQAAIQVTYHPDRIAQPLKRRGPRGSAQFQPVAWEDAIAELVARLDTNDPKSLAFLTPRRRTQRQTLIAQFMSGLGAPAPVTFELFGDDVVRRANALSFGRDQLATFDLAASRYVIGFGADFLGTWNSPVSQSAAYGQMRQGRSGNRATFVQVEARMSQTGANADEWVPVRPGTDGVLALGLARVIVSAHLRSPDAAGRAGRLLDGWGSGLADYDLATVERITGVPAARVERLAREFAEHGPAVALIGGAPLAHTNGLFHAVAINALNALVGSVEQPGGVFFTPQPDPVVPNRANAPPARSLQTIVTEILTADRSPVQVLLVDGVNPVFATPRAWRVRDALEKVPFIASFGGFLDETSILADLILPDHSFLESWVGSVAESGSRRAVVAIAPPVMRPLHQTRATPDVLLDIGRRLHRPLAPPLPWQTFEELLRASSERPSSSAAPTSGLRTLPAPVRFAAPRFDGSASDYPFHFLPYASQAFLDGSLAHLPWLQELPDVLSTAMWSTWIEINPKTAERLQIVEGDLVEIASQHGALRAPALVSPGIAPDVIAMPAGQGHDTYTRYASGRGANPISILAPLVEADTGALAWAATRVRIARVGDGRKQLILFAGEKREHPHGHLR